MDQLCYGDTNEAGTLRYLERTLLTVAAKKTAPPQTPYEVLGVSKSATADEIKVAYRALAFRWHPDRNPGDRAAEDRFKAINAANDVLTDPDKRKQYDRSGTTTPVVISTRKFRITLGRRIAQGDIADIFEGRDENTGRQLAVKIVRSPGNNDLMEAEVKTLRQLWPRGSDGNAGMLKRFVPFEDSFKVNDGKGARVVTTMERLTGWATLEVIRTKFPAGVAMEHGVWMLNRTLEALAFLHDKQGIVHGAITPSHVLPYGGGDVKDPWNHCAKLLGFGCSVPVGGTVPAIAPKWKDFYAPEILRKRPVTGQADVYMAVKCCIYVMGGDPLTDHMPATVPQYLARFLRAVTAAGPLARPGAWELHESLKEHMARHYGPKRYVHFEMPNLN